MACPYCHATDHSSLGKCPRWTGAKFRAPPVCTVRWTDDDWARWAGPLPADPPERPQPLTQPGAP